MSMENDTLRETLRLLLTIATTSSCELVAQPIDDDAFDAMTTEVLDAPSNDAYACHIVPDVAGANAPRRDGDTLIFERGANGYSRQCVQPSSAEQTACWQSGPFACDDEAVPCTLIQPRAEAQTGATVMAGGEYSVCAHPCATDEDCPAPSSGTAVAKCADDPALYGFPDLYPEAGIESAGGYRYTGSGACMIGCAGGEACPDGFTCIEPTRVVLSADGGEWLTSPAPAQCLQFKAITLRE